MKIVVLFLFVSALLSFSIKDVNAHQVWAHNACADPNDTVDFFYKSKDVYVNLSKMKSIWQEASFSLELGILAEFDHKLDKSKPLQPEQYIDAFNGYKKLRLAMDEYDSALAELQKESAQCQEVALYQEALKKTLEQARPFPRVTKQGVIFSDASGHVLSKARFSDASGLDSETVSVLYSTNDILFAWKTDLSILKETLDEVIEAMNDALPLTDKGEFAGVMLSGRNKFGDKMPQFTDMYSAYRRMYVRGVLATITTTMHVYPTGYEWLTVK